MRVETVCFFLFVLSGQVVKVISDETTLYAQNSDSDLTTVPFDTLVTVRLPKCCPLGYSVGSSKCTMNTDIEFVPKLSIHNHTDVAFDDEPLDLNFVNVVTYNHDPCKDKKFPVFADDEPKFLVNGSLMLRIRDYRGILGQDEFCIDTIFNPKENNENVYPFVCVRKHIFPDWLVIIYITFSSISALLYMFAFIFYYRNNVASVHKKSFMIYSLSMSLTYSIIILLQFLTTCSCLGILLQFFMILSFAWTFILSFELAWNVHFLTYKNNSNQFHLYAVFSLVYSGVFVLKSALFDFTPDLPSGFFKPQFKMNMCSYMGWVPQTGYFYVAAGLPICLSGLCLLYFLFRINHIKPSGSELTLNQWKNKLRMLRLKYGRLFFLWIVMLSWMMDSFSSNFKDLSALSILVLVVQMSSSFLIVPLFTYTMVQKVFSIQRKPRIDNLQELIELNKNLE